MTDTFTWPVRVYWEDTDAGGVVYHSNYLNFMERARTEWLRAAGWEQQRLREEQGVLFAVRSMQVEFHQPARLDDALEIEVRVAHRRKASLVLSQSIRRRGAERPLCDAEVKVACIDAERFRPCPIPPAMMGDLTGEQ